MRPSSSSSSAGVHRLAQGLARLEVRHQLLGDQHLRAAARVAAHARRAAVDREAAEAADLDAVPRASASDIASSMVLTANSVSRCVSCEKRSASG
jgi:hypothetical protein